MCRGRRPPVHGTRGFCPPHSAEAGSTGQVTSERTPPAHSVGFVARTSRAPPVVKTSVNREQIVLSTSLVAACVAHRLSLVRDVGAFRRKRYNCLAQGSSSVAYRIDCDAQPQLRNSARIPSHPLSSRSRVFRLLGTRCAPPLCIQPSPIPHVKSRLVLSTYILTVFLPHGRKNPTCPGQTPHLGCRRGPPKPRVSDFPQQLVNL